MKKKVRSTVTKGHGVASGRADDSHYPDGTIAPQTFHMIAPEYRFNQVAWVAGFPAD